MLSIQHILHSLYTYDMTYLHRYGASVVYPDAIRAYTNGSRKYSHFEHVFRDKYYYMVFPLSMDAPRKIIEEHIKEVKEEIEAEIPSEFQSEILKPCAIGEDTSLTLFCKTNTDLPEKMYTGIVTHLKQDIAFDKFIRMHIDCSKKLRDKFVFQEMSFCDSIRNTQMYFEGINQTAEATMQFLVYLASKYTQNKNLLSRGVDEEKLYIVSQELSVINQHAYRAKITELRNLMRSKEPGYIDFHMFSETSPKEYLDVIRVTTGCYGSNESVYFLNLVRLCAYTKKEIKKVILSTKSYTEKDLVDLPTIIDQWKNEYRSDRSLAWPTL